MHRTYALAGSSDPVWGCGLSRTLRDVRLLRDRLLSDGDWLLTGERSLELVDSVASFAVEWGNQLIVTPSPTQPARITLGERRWVRE